jgi:hypothetical protein
MSSTAPEQPYSRANPRGSQMSRAECFRALGVEPDTSWEVIQQAYKDLVRVWHPDRFQSDPQLQDRAGRQLQTINAAYFELKNSHIFRELRTETAPQPKPPGAHRFTRDARFRRPLKAAWLGVICLALLAIGSLLVNALRVPAPDLTILQDHAATVALVTPANGTELLRTRMSGASELWVSNETNQDVLATLVLAGTESPVRAIYVQAKNKVCIRHIAPGLYDLLAEMGENWDANHIRFQTGRHALGRRGPFQCVDVTWAQGASGSKYNVVLKIAEKYSRQIRRVDTTVN